MCRMIAFSNQTDIDTAYIFQKLQYFAESGIHSPHPHGWGTYLENSNNEIFSYKSINPIYEDKFEKFNSSVGIFHARKSSPGLQKGLLQLHPFMKSNTVFAHNGTIYDIEIDNPFNSDSFELLKQIDNFNSVKKLAIKIKRFYNDYSFTAINFFMLKSSTLYVLELYKEEKEYYTLWINTDHENGIVVSSEPFDDPFKPLKNGDLLKIENGILIDKVNILEDL